MPPPDGPSRPEASFELATLSPGLSEPASPGPIPSPSATTMILEERSPQAANPARRSILKPPTFHFQFLIQSQATHVDSTIPLPRHLTDRIPLELVHKIIDTLRHDKETLQRCALVCKLWLARARPLLLPKKFTVAVQSQTGSEIFSILTAPGSQLADFVHTLSVQSSATFPLRLRPFAFSADDHDAAARQSISFNHYLLPFIGNCRALRTLIFQGITIPPRAPANTSAIPVQIKALGHITRLELTRCAFSTFEELLFAVCARRSLLELTLADITVLQWPPARLPPPSLYLPRGLRTLALSTPGQTLLLKWIASRDRIPPLRTVSLGGARDEDDQRATGAFLRALGSSLEHLTLSLGRAAHDVDLAYNPCLQSLRISHYVIGGTGARGSIDPAGALVRLLRSVVSPHVVRIELAFVNAPQDVLLMPWALVSTEFDAPQFAALKLLRIRLAGTKARWDGAVRKAFPRLARDRKIKILWDSLA